MGQFSVRPKQTNTKRIELCAAFDKEFKYSLRFDDFHIEITCNGFGETTVRRLCGVQIATIAILRAASNEINTEDA